MLQRFFFDFLNETAGGAFGLLERFWNPSGNASFHPAFNFDSSSETSFYIQDLLPH